jgi:hypothetical protein
MNQFDETAEDPFNLDYQFFMYLKRYGVHWEDLPPIQFREMKRAFYGAMGQMLMLYMNDIPQMPEKESTPKILWMRQQIFDFWKEELEKYQTQQN